MAVCPWQRPLEIDAGAEGTEETGIAQKMATLFVVSTPIGNLGDITYRAIEVLGRVRRILAEDTRRTSILLRRYGIETPRVSAHAHNEQARAAQLVEWLDAGEDVALVSDAGTPLVSDPGARLVRAALAAGHAVVPVPGASALLAALVASGIEPEPFTYYGFPPRSGRARMEVLQAASSSRHTSVFYEAPGRVARLLADLATACGGGRQVAVARELTKLHESIFRGTLEDAATRHAGQRVRGEVVVVLSGTGRDVVMDEGSTAATEVVRGLLKDGMKPSAAAREAARRLAIPRSEAYRLALQEAGSGKEQH
jgi:16S rRNA (cytidine1402-2'-O)-methyltransferase